MKVHRRIRRKIRRQGDGINLAADVNIDFDGNIESRRSPGRERERSDQDQRPTSPRETGARDQDGGGE